MSRHYGRCPMGQRCVSTIPHGHWQSSTFIAALRHESIEAPFLIEGPSMPRFSRLILSRCFVHNCARATRSSWTTSPPTKSITSASYSRLEGLAFATCRLTALISIPLNRLSPNSKRICVRRPPALWTSFIQPWRQPSTPSPPHTVEASFVTPNMRLSK